MCYYMYVEYESFVINIMMHIPIYHYTIMMTLYPTHSYLYSTCKQQQQQQLGNNILLQL